LVSSLVTTDSAGSSVVVRMAGGLVGTSIVAVLMGADTTARCFDGFASPGAPPRLHGAQHLHRFPAPAWLQAA
jgi:hypothetical protein